MTRVRLFVRPLGLGVFEAKPLYGSTSNLLREGRAPSWCPVVTWPNKELLLRCLGELPAHKKAALDKGMPFSVGMDLREFLDLVDRQAKPEIGDSLA